MEKPTYEHSYAFGLVTLIGGIVVTALGFFEGEIFSILGFFLLLFFFLTTLDKTVLFVNVRRDLWLLIGYAAIVAALFYLLFPYASNKEALRPFWSRWYVEMLAAAGYVPALILKGLNHFFDVPVSYHLTKPRTHYPFALGFWLFFLQITITIKLYERVGKRVNKSPMPCLLLAYTFALGALVMLWLQAVGIIIMVVSASFLLRIYLQVRKQRKASTVKKEEPEKKVETISLYHQAEIERKEQLKTINDKIGLD